MRQCEHLAALDRKLPTVLAGKAQGGGPADLVQLAELCQRYKKHYAAAARFYADAFEKAPALAPGRRHEAARAAAVSVGVSLVLARLEQTRSESSRRRTEIEGERQAHERRLVETRTAVRSLDAELATLTAGNADLAPLHDIAMGEVALADADSVAALAAFRAAVETFGATPPWWKLVFAAHARIAGSVIS